MKSFETNADFWGIKNRLLINQVHEYFVDEIYNNRWIQVYLYMHIEKSKLFTKNGKLKKIDASNRIKATHDMLSEIIRIDDKHFSVGKSEFVLSNENKIDVLLRSVKIKTKEDIEYAIESNKARFLLL
jgi:hypothetical protein